MFANPLATEAASVIEKENSVLKSILIFEPFGTSKSTFHSMERIGPLKPERIILIDPVKSV